MYAKTLGFLFAFAPCLFGFIRPGQAQVTIVAGSNTFSYGGYVGQGLTTVPLGPADIALASNGGVGFCNAFFTSTRSAAQLNEGLYSDPDSWLTLSTAQTVTLYNPLNNALGTVNDSFAGIALPGGQLYNLTGFSFGRDNTGVYSDRSVGTMYLQYTTVTGTANITNTSPSADSNWLTFGAITTTDGYDHLFNFASPIQASGLRIVTQAGNCIDELAIYGSSVAVVSTSSTWTSGGNPDFAWSNTSNWTTSPGTLSALTFAGSAGLNNTNDLTSFIANGITFDSTAAAFNLSGNSLTLASDVTNNSTATQVINLNMVLQNVNTSFNTNAGNLQINGVLSGSGALVKNGPYTLVLAGSNTYGGSTVVNGGKLELASGGSIASPAIGIGAATLQVDAGGSFIAGALVTMASGATLVVGANISVSIQNGSAGSVVLANGAVLTQQGIPVDSTFAGSISGTGGITDSGPGNWRFGGGANYSGPTTVTSGVLVLNNTADTLGTSLLTVNSPGQVDLTAGTGPKTVTVGGLTGNGTIYSFSTLGTLLISPTSGSQTFAGAIGGSYPNVNLVMAGTGTQVLGGVNNYVGTTTINGGKLVINGTLPNSPVNVNGGGALGGRGNLGQPVTVAGGSNAATWGAIDLTNSAVSSLTLSNSGTALTLGDSVSGASFLAFDISKASADSINLPSGTLQLNAGGVTIAFDAYQGVPNNGIYPLISFPVGSTLLGSFTLASSDEAALGGNATLITSSSAVYLQIGSVATPTAASWNGGTSANWSVSTNWTGGLPGAITDVTFNDVGAQHLTTNLDTSFSINSLSFSDSATTSVTIASSNGSTLTLGLGGLTTTQNTAAHFINVPVILGTSQTWNINSPSPLTVNGSISGLAGNESLTIVSTASTAGSGYLVLNGPNTYTGATTITSGSVELAAGCSLASTSIVIDGTLNNAALQIDPGAKIPTNVPVSMLSQYATLVVGSNVSMALSAPQMAGNQTVSLANGAILTQTVADNGFCYANISGSGGLTLNGGIWRLLSGATYSGPTTVNNGILVLQSANDTLGTSLLTVNSPGQVDLTAGTGLKTVTVGGLTGNGTIYSFSTLGTLLISPSSGSQTFAGTIGGSYPNVNLVMAGTGTQVLSGVNNYVGTTTVNSGVLAAAVPGAISPQSDVTVNGGTLDVSAAVQTVRSLTVAGGALNLNAGNLLSVTNAAAFAGALNLSGLGNLSSGTTELISYLSYSGSFDSYTALPPGETLVYNSKELDVVGPGIMLSGTAIWTGSASSEWSTNSIASPKNWKQTNGTPTDFVTGNAVVFNDIASGSTTVDVSVGKVFPYSTTFNNSATNYTLQGSAGIANGSVTKSGTGTLTITNNNSFVGGLYVNGGTVAANFGTTASLGGGTNPAVTVGGPGSTLALSYVGGSVPTNNAAITLNDGATLKLSTSSTLSSFSNAIVTQPINVSGNSTINLTFSTAAGSRGTEFELNSTTPAHVTINLSVGGSAANSTGAGWQLYGYELDQPAQLAAGSSLTINGGATSGGSPSPLEFRTGGSPTVQAMLANTDVVFGAAPVAVQLGNHAGANVPQFNSLAGGAATTISSDNLSSTVQINNGTVAGANFVGTISDGGGSNPMISVLKNGSGTQIFSGLNTFSGSTTVTGGALQAIDGVGLPSSSNLVFSGSLAQNVYGAALQSSGTFSRALGSAAGQVQWTGDGGFSANGGPLTVNVNSGAALVWNNNSNSNGTQYFVGDGNVLTFGSPTANAQVNFVNGLDVNGGTRQIDVAAGLGGDSALISGNISDSAGGGGLLKTGAGLLILSGSNTYSGGTTVESGTLVINSASSLLDGSDLAIVSSGAGAVFSPPIADLPTVNVVPVPEPSTVTLLVVCALTIGWRNWRHTSKKLSV